MPLSIKHPTRRKLYAFIRLAPGRHLRDLERELEIPLGTLEHHLNKLVEDGKVVTRQINRYKAYYPATHMEPADRDCLYYLAQDSPRAILLALADAAGRGMDSAELSDAVGLATSTVSHHASKLVQAGILTKTKQNPKTILRAVEPERIKRLALEYPGTYLDRYGEWFRMAWGSDGVASQREEAEIGSDGASQGPRRDRPVGD